MRLLPEIDIIGCKLTLGDSHALFDQIECWVQTGGQYVVVYGNPHVFNLAYEDGWLCAFINRADWVCLDGVGLRLGAWLLGHPTPQRTTYADDLWDLAARCEYREYRVFLLGSHESIVHEAAYQLQAVYADLNIVGTHHGYFDKTPGSDENCAVVRQIQQAQPDILLVGFGVPLQEQWIAQNRVLLGDCVIMTCGATFDYIADALPRAPLWMRRLGLEWFGRMLIEPRRLWRRYVIGNPKFMLRVLRQRLRRFRS